MKRHLCAHTYCSIYCPAISSEKLGFLQKPAKNQALYTYRCRLLGVFSDIDSLKFNIINSRNANKAYFLTDTRILKSF